MPDYLKEWFQELEGRWIRGEKLSKEDQHRLSYLRSTYINEIIIDCFHKAVARYCDDQLSVE